MTQPAGRIEEGVTLSGYTVEVIDYLQRVYELLEAGELDRLTGDPFYDRGELPPLTDEQIDRVVTAIDAEFATEIGSYASYHRNRSGATTTPDFHRLDATSRRIMVEGLDAIVRRSPVK